MSVVWIKTDRENNIHSIYCDGRVIDDSNQIHNEDNCKIKQFSIGNNSILIGTVGSTYSCDYLTNHIYEELSNEFIQNILNLIREPQTISKAEELLNEMVENILCKKFLNNKEDFFPSIVLSINGNLFFGQSYSFSTLTEDGSDCYKFLIEYKNINHIECGSGAKYVKTILEYDKDADPQKILDVTASLITSVNNHLFKLENINYGNK